MSDDVRRTGASLDTTVPNIARVHDYFLGGKDNFAADRAAAEEILAIAPEIRIMAREALEFQARVVKYLVGEGVTQFVNIGSGIPNKRNTHQIAHALTPDARVVYAARDPVVLSHSRALLATDERIGVVDGDIMHPVELVADPVVRRLIDRERPVAVLITSALQYLPDEDDPFKRVAELRDWMGPGSHLVIVHAVFDSRPEVAGPIGDVYRRVLNRPEKADRTLSQVRGFFDGMDLVEPGLVYIRQWRPENPLNVHRPEKIWLAGGVARKSDA
ncbi:SAM-dependent methyltransferase [Sphaerisporangium sp. TRM90804]|uniref:SAM-dependent methyltransferase n=1 Tax=Sphaerisporangium sp. TRM90804 TaxID=3031113 RepID=UPI00244C7A16|nr:SAM-dependent methyltransferase [Sphaerisporangium sp. TRM90804]MDH2424688.1 SAM-dependent methyltransferase [Sphaerisporangium sp. TRM90804]